MLLKLFIPPSNLITKRNNKLLDYDSAQSAYEKVKDQQLKQVEGVEILVEKDSDLTSILGKTSTRSFQTNLRNIE